MSTVPHPQAPKPKQRRLSRAASVNSSSNPGSPIIPPHGGPSISAVTIGTAYPSSSSSSALAITPTGHSHETSSSYFSTSPKPVHTTPNLSNGNHHAGQHSFISTGTSSAHYSHEGRAAFSPTYSVQHGPHSNGAHNTSRTHSSTERRDGKRPSFGPAFATVGEEKARRSGILYDGSSEESGGSARNSAEAQQVVGPDGGVRAREKDREKEKSWERERLKEKLHLGFPLSGGTHGLGYKQEVLGGVPMAAVEEGPKPPGPKMFGIELKWISLLTLALQNAFLTIIMHYSRITANPARTYSAASAVLMNELLKGSISLLIALRRTDAEMTRAESHALSPVLNSGVLPAREDAASPVDTKPKKRFPMSGVSGGKYGVVGRGNARVGQRRGGDVTPTSVWEFAHDLFVPYTKGDRWNRLFSDILSGDCWKLGIPAVLYVIQNNLQYVAASNLDVATFQVTYQMKILTTAFFSVIMLRKRLTTSKWLSLLLLAIGVGIVQIQSNSSSHSAAAQVAPSASAAIVAAHEHVAGSLRSEIPGETTATDEITDLPFLDQVHTMQPWKGFVAVMLACMTSGLAGVYFEMVLKGSKADLWTRNVQLSMFSLLPALIPVFFTGNTAGPGSGLWGLLSEPFRNFSWWAWGTVFTQVFGGLVTALVIKYSDNILKGFATSLSIILSFLASVGLFDYPVTLPFVVGSMVVLMATWMYNQPETSSGALVPGLTSKANRQDVATMGSPVSASAPIIGETPKPSRTSSMVSLLGLAGSSAGNSRNGTPGIQPLSHFQPPADYLAHQKYRAGSPAQSHSPVFHTAPPSPQLNGPNGRTLSTQPSLNNLQDQGLVFTKHHVNGTKRGGSPARSGAGTPNGNGMRHSSGMGKPVLMVETTDLSSKMR